MINASGFDTTLDITGELFAKNQILSADRAGRAQERDDQPQDVPGYSDDRSRQLQHALIMPESARGCRRWTPKQPRRELLRTTGVLLPVVIATEVLGALAIILGWQTRFTALLLAGYTLLTALIFHTNFADQIEMIMFLKNVSIAGGFLLLVANGAGPLSLDRRLAK